jgi:hypothetical protein
MIVKSSDSAVDKNDANLLKEAEKARVHSLLLSSHKIIQSNDIVVDTNAANSYKEVHSNGVHSVILFKLSCGTLLGACYQTDNKTKLNKN